MEEPSVAQARSILFSGRRQRIRRMYSSFACGELQVQWDVPLGRYVLSYHVFKYFRTCSCKRTLKISAELYKTYTLDKIYRINSTYSVLAANWVLIISEARTRRSFA